jgi:hypothetical protein
MVPTPIMSTLDPSACSLANPACFEDFLDAGGALTDRGDWAEDAGYNHRARKLDFEHHFRALVLLHLSAYESARDPTWAAQEDGLFEALAADFNISVPGFCGAMAGRPLAPYRRMLTQVMQAVEEIGTQRLRGLDRITGTQVAALFGPVCPFDATVIDLPPSLAEAAEASPEGAAYDDAFAGSNQVKLQLKIDGGTGAVQEALLTRAAR